MRLYIAVMEQKKNKQVNLEDEKKTSFLLGLVFVLSLLFVALEFNHVPDSLTYDENIIDELAQDLEMVSTLEKDDINEIAIIPQKQASSERIKIVDEETTIDNAEVVQESGTLDAFSQEETEKPEPQILPSTTASDDAPLRFRIVSQLPEFPGGMVEYMKWLTKNLRYPEVARQQGIQGKVVVSFIVNTDGSIADAKIASSVDPVLDREAMRVIRMMPRWKPGIQNDQPCRTMFAVPIVFKL